MVKMKCVTGVLYNVCVFIHEVNMYFFYVYVFFLVYMSKKGTRFWFRLINDVDLVLRSVIFQNRFCHTVAE